MIETNVTLAHGDFLAQDVVDCINRHSPVKIYVRKKSGRRMRKTLVGEHLSACVVAGKVVAKSKFIDQAALKLAINANPDCFRISKA